MPIRDGVPGHGSFTLTITGQILEMAVAGQWNVERADQFMAAYRQVGQKIDGQGAWGLLVVITGDADLFSPEAEARMIELFASPVNVNLVAGAVTIEKQQPAPQRVQVERYMRGTSQRFEFFPSRHEALAWLSDQVAEAKQ